MTSPPLSSLSPPTGLCHDRSIGRSESEEPPPVPLSLGSRSGAPQSCSSHDMLLTEAAGGGGTEAYLMYPSGRQTLEGASVDSRVSFLSSPSALVCSPKVHVQYVQHGVLPPLSIAATRGMSRPRRTRSSSVSRHFFLLLLWVPASSTANGLVDWLTDGLVSHRLRSDYLVAVIPGQVT